MEWGKNPGLNLDVLHKLGLTGKGISVAYVDQPIGDRITHNELKHIDIHYNSELVDDASKQETMHGNAVLSLIAG